MFVQKMRAFNVDEIDTWLIVVHLGGDNVTHAGATASNGAGCTIKIVHVSGLKVKKKYVMFKIC